jgi:hypothetical protein
MIGQYLYFNTVFGAGLYSKPEVTYVTFHKEKISNIPASMHLRFSSRLQFLDDLVLLGSILCLHVYMTLERWFP